MSLKSETTDLIFEKRDPPFLIISRIGMFIIYGQPVKAFSLEIWLIRAGKTSPAGLQHLSFIHNKDQQRLCWRILPQGYSISLPLDGGRDLLSETIILQ
jgi:hypothetical protein